MPTRGEMKLEGMNELIRHLNELPDKVEQISDAAVRAGAEHLKDKIEHHPNIPRSNKAKEHGADNVEIQKAPGGFYDIGFRDEFFYLLFHEIGAKGGVYKRRGEYFITPDIPARPFMRPALEENIRSTQDKMGDVIQRRLGL
jgi:HK97 gp10 family phage protein